MFYYTGFLQPEIRAIGKFSACVNNPDRIGGIYKVTSTGQTGRKTIKIVNFADFPITH